MSSPPSIVGDTEHVQVPGRDRGVMGLTGEWRADLSHVPRNRRSSCIRVVLSSVTVILSLILRLEPRVVSEVLVTNLGQENQTQTPGRTLAASEVTCEGSAWEPVRLLPW